MKECEEEVIQFKENQFYIGQDLNNVYVYTKFEAEKKILFLQLYFIYQILCLQKILISI